MRQGAVPLCPRTVRDGEIAAGAKSPADGQLQAKPQLCPDILQIL